MTKLDKLLEKKTFDTLDYHCEISSIKDDEVFPLKVARRKVAEKIHEWIEILHTFINPEPTMIQAHDSDSLGDEDREKISLLLSQLILIYKRDQILELGCSKDHDIAFLVECAGVLPTFAESIKSYIAITMTSYNAGIPKKVSKVNYLG